MADNQSVGKINLDLGINQSGFFRELNNIGNSVKAQVGKIAAAAAAAFTVKKVFDFGKQAVDMASDLDEVQTVVDTAFGDMSYKMEEFAKTAIKQFGISELSAKRTGSTFMAMAKGMDMSSENASNMALQLTALSADIASFYNISQELAETKLKSVFTGETETLKDLGIVMTQTNLKAFALSKGITKNIDDMSQAEQVQLRYAYIMKQTTLAQGDFSKTSNGWANQVRILNEQWKEFLTTVGTGIKSVLTPLVQWLNIVVGKMISAANAVKTLVNTMRGITDTGEENAKSAQSASDSVSDVGDSAQTAAKKIKKSLMGFDELNILTKSTSENSGDLSGALGDIGMPGLNKQQADTVNETAERIKAILSRFKNWYNANFADTFSKAWGNIKPQLDAMKNGFKETWSGIKSLCEPFKAYISNNFVPYVKTAIISVSEVVGGLLEMFNRVFFDLINNVFMPFAQTMLTTVLPILTDTASMVIQLFTQAFTGIRDLFLKIWDGTLLPFIKLFVKIWQQMWSDIYAFYQTYAQPIFTGLQNAISNTISILNTWYEVNLKPIFENLINVLDELWQNHVRPFFKEVLDLIGVLITEGLNIYNEFLAPVVEWLLTYVAPAFREVFNLAVRIVGDAVGVMIDRAKAFITQVKGVITIISGLLTGDLKKALDGVEMFFGGFWDGIAARFKGGINIMIELINTFSKSLNLLLRGISYATHGAVNFQIPQIPKLAKGGIVTQPTLAMVGERGREAVMPLENNTGWIDELALKLSALMPKGSGGGANSQPIVLQINETELGRVIVQTSQKYNRQVGVAVL